MEPVKCAFKTLLFRIALCDQWWLEGNQWQFNPPDFFLLKRSALRSAPGRSVPQHTLMIGGAGPHPLSFGHNTSIIGNAPQGKGN